MISNAVRWTRDYLAARDLETEVAGGLAVLERLPSPLPSDVRRAAMGSLVLFGGLSCAGALFVVGGGAAVVIMPIVMGREGVGTAMITLFAVCVSAVVSAILLLAARSAARVIRRERRGIRSLQAFATFSAVVTIVAAAFTWWLNAAFFAEATSDADTVYWLIPLRLLQLLLFAWFTWVAGTLRRYDRRLTNVIQR